MRESLAAHTLHECCQIADTALAAPSPDAARAAAAGASRQLRSGDGVSVR
ncbi:hypothetical protein KBX34_06965 [Micromonospora sp. M61]|nr:hypothetical protein [Micromonospora sp. M61]